MKRRIGLLLAAASILSAVGMFAPSPASALPTGDACIGQGRATLSSGLGLPVQTAKRTVNFTFGFTLGTCIAKGGLAATGTLTGWCGNSEGRGTTSNGRDFGWTSLGTFLVLQGEITGLVGAAADATQGAAGSCAGGTATEFIVTGVIIKMNCDFVNSKTKGKLPLPPNADLQYKIWACV